MNITMMNFKQTTDVGAAANRSNASELKKKQTRHVFLQHISSIMLALLLSVLVNVGWGQSFTAVPYNFQDEPSFNNNGFKISPQITNKLKFTSTAANNYGIWATSHEGYWYLLSNDMQNETPASSGQAAVPSGVVDFGRLQGVLSTDPDIEKIIPSQTKVVANLDGSVRFISIRAIKMVSSDGLFLVQGFNDNTRTDKYTDPIHRQIDIGFSGVSPKTDPLLKKIVKKDIIVYNNNVSDLVNGANRRQYLDEKDWRNSFDVACDKNFIYIVWEWGNVAQARKEIYATVLRMSDGQVVDNTWPRHIAPGARPSVACNVRNESNQPKFDIAYVTYAYPYPYDMQPGNPAYLLWDPNLNGTDPVFVKWWRIDNGNVTIESMPQSKKITSGGTLIGLSAPTQVKMLVAPTDPSVLIPAKAIFVGSNGVKGPWRPAQNQAWNPASEKDFCDNIIMYSIIQNTKPTFAVTVDGVDIKPHGAPFTGSPQDVNSQQSDSYQVFNWHIEGVANPYDGKNTDEYDEFHCSYVLSDIDGNGASQKPLYIARGVNNGIFTSPDTRTILNRTSNNGGVTFNWLEEDPDNPHINTFGYQGTICMSANQMGINVHWVSKGTGQKTYLSRDIRSFDEDITENTLVTHTCKVGDGQPHLGTLGTTLRNGKKMTLWTDPNFDISATGPTSGIYTAQTSLLPNLNNVKFHIEGQDAELKIGESGTNANGAMMYVMPNIEFTMGFNPSTQQFASTRNNKLTIHPNSTVEWYGTPSTTIGATPPLGKANWFGAGELKLVGESATMSSTTNGYPLSFTKPATLNIHGGAELRLPETFVFTANNSIIDCKYEASIEPVYSPPATNSNATGLLSLHGKATIEQCKILGHHISTSANPVIVKVESAITMAPPYTGNQLTLTNSLILNDNSTGRSILECRNIIPSTVPYKWLGKCVISGGRFDATTLLASSPIQKFEVKDAEFMSIIQSGVHFQRDISSTLEYVDLFVDNNTFSTYRSNGVNGILFDGFSLNHTYTIMVEDVPVQVNRINITDNDFTATTSGNNRQTAIHMLNSSSAIANNVISGSNYKYGILNETGGVTFPPTTFTFMCSNAISNCNGPSTMGAAVKTERWNGYLKLGNIHDCEVGYQSTNGDDGNVFFTTLKDCTGPGILLNNSQAASPSLNISIGPGYAGNNTIQKNNTTSGNPEGQIQVEPSTALQIGKIGTSTIFGQNNIIRNSSTDDFFFSTGSVSIGNAEGNYWENGDGSVYNPPTTATNPPFDGVTYTNATVTGGPYSFSNVFCSSGISAVTESNGQQRQSYIHVTEDTCELLYGNAKLLKVNGKYQDAYDSMRFYVESCPTHYYVVSAFSSLTGSNDARTNDRIKYSEYREWLKSVLYLNPDTAYYCADVVAILQTFFWFDDERGMDVNGSNAVVKYLLENSRCPNAQQWLIDGYKANREQQLKIYRDTVQDSLKTPLDTTLPSLEELRLGILRGQTGVVAAASNSVVRISSLTVERNPFTDEVALKVELNSSTMLRLDVFDELGRSVYGEGLGYKPKGDYRFPINGKSWASGVYFVRLSTSGGEMQTIKVIKE
jgi:hypothetical protein